jgi:hypothetical protein
MLFQTTQKSRPVVGAALLFPLFRHVNTEVAPPEKL